MDKITGYLLYPLIIISLILLLFAFYFVSVHNPQSELISNRIEISDLLNRLTKITDSYSGKIYLRIQNSQDLILAYTSDDSSQSTNVEQQNLEIIPLYSIQETFDKCVIRYYSKIEDTRVGVVQRSSKIFICPLKKDNILLGIIVMRILGEPDENKELIVTNIISNYSQTIVGYLSK